MKIILCTFFSLICIGDFAYANSSKELSTYVEQISATINGRQYSAQVSRVQIPGDTGRTIVVNSITIASPTGISQTSNAVTVEMRTELNGTAYNASMSLPLTAAEQQKAVALAQNQIDWTRRNAPAAQSNQIQKHAAYSQAVPINAISMNYSPKGIDTQLIMDNIRNSALNHSEAAYKGLMQQQQQSNLDAQRYAQTIQQTKESVLQLRKAAEHSNFNLHQSLTNFSAQMQSLQNYEIANLALQISQADPVLENILTQDKIEISNDIRRSTVDVSPLNQNSAENIKQYGDRFAANGLLREGLFKNQDSFPATALGHRVLESANLLSDATMNDSSLATSNAGMQLIGAGYVYLNASMHSLKQGRVEEAERFAEQGRSIARALRGENLSVYGQALASKDKAIEVHEQAIRDTLGIHGEGRELLEQGFSKASPSSKEGLFALSMGRSLLSNPQGLSNSELKSIGLNLLDVALGMVPVAGALKSLLYMAAGENLLTGEKLTELDYVFCAIDVLSLGASSAFVKVASKLPGNELLRNGLKVGTAHIQQFGNFISGSVEGIRTIQKLAPGLITKNFISNPGAVLSLGQNISRYGGAEFAKGLIGYSAKHSLGIVETAHISRFGGGLTKIVSVENFHKYPMQTSILAGKDGGRMFVASTEQFERALKKMGNEKDLEKWIGITEGSSSKYMRIDMKFDFNMSPRLPTGKEAGANSFFQLGGKTTGNAAEVAVDPISMGKVNVRGEIEF